MSRRAKPPVSAWIVRERKRLGLKPHDLALRLTAMGLPVAEGTPRTWEAGRSPSPENIEGLERIFGTVAPDMDRPADATPAGLSDLTAALTAQAESFAKMLAFALERDRSVEARIRALEAETRSLRERLGAEASRAQSTPPQTGE